MFEENIQEPLAILDQFKQYEYLLNVDKKELIENLFDNKKAVEEGGNKKADISEIRDAITKYHQAADEIQNLSCDYIDTPMFRVQAHKMKETLSKAAISIRDKLIHAVEKWCNDTVKHIDKTFNDMENQIRTVPTNEKELVFIRDFIKVSKEVTQIDLQEQLKEAVKH